VSRSLSRVQAVLLGAAVLTGLVLAVGGLFAVGSRQWFWDDALTVRAAFPEVRGVERGTRVRIQGVDAGEVAEVRPPEAPGGAVVLVLRLKGIYRPLVRADAAVQIASEGMLGGKVVEVHPGTAAAEPVADNALLATRSAAELADLVGQVSRVVEALDREKQKVHEVVENTNKLLLKSQEAVNSIGQVAEGIKKAPLVRSYVEDPMQLLHRPNCERNRQVFAEADLFPPGQATLTEQGRQRLNDLGPWIMGLSKHKGAEVLVAAYADPQSASPALARSLTQNQAAVVCAYLKDSGAVYKKFWVLSREAKSLGLGVEPPPVPEKEPLPAARVEVIVFVPQG